MYSGSLPTILNIYKDKKNRSSQSEIAKLSCGAYYYLQCPDNTPLPFQFEISTGEAVTELKYYFDDNETHCYDYSTQIIPKLIYKDLGNGKTVVFFYADFQDLTTSPPLQAGRFYIQFRVASPFNSYYLYSDTFEIPSKLTPLHISAFSSSAKFIAFSFSDTYDFTATDGGVYHVSGSPIRANFRQRIYLHTLQSDFTINYENEDTYKDDMGIEKALFQKCFQRVSYTGIVPYSVLRGLTVCKMCDTVSVTDLESGRSGAVRDFDIEHSVIEGGAFYQIKLSFTENVVFKKMC